jgi:hypothetical protein
MESAVIDQLLMSLTGFDLRKEFVAVVPDTGRGLPRLLESFCFDEASELVSTLRRLVGYIQSELRISPAKPALDCK